MAKNDQFQRFSADFGPTIDFCGVTLQKYDHGDSKKAKYDVFVIGKGLFLPKNTYFIIKL